jgi:hypothetical protein
MVQYAYRVTGAVAPSIQVVDREYWLGNLKVPP